MKNIQNLLVIVAAFFLFSCNSEPENLLEHCLEQIDSCKGTPTEEVYKRGDEIRKASGCDYADLETCALEAENVCLTENLCARENTVLLECVAQFCQK